MHFDLLCVVHYNSIDHDSNKGCRCFIFLLNFGAFISLIGVFCGFGDAQLVVVIGYQSGTGLVAPSLALFSATSIVMVVRIKLESDGFSDCVYGFLVVSVLFDNILLVQATIINYYCGLGVQITLVN